MERIRQGKSHAKVRDAMALSIGVMEVSKERSQGFPRRCDGGVKREKSLFPENVIYIPGKWSLIPVEFQDSYFIKCLSALYNAVILKIHRCTLSICLL